VTVKVVEEEAQVRTRQQVSRHSFERKYVRSIVDGFPRSSIVWQNL